MKKRVWMSIVLIAMLQCSTIAYANANINSENVTATESNQVSPRAEVQEWKWRVSNGKLQKRLWSVTYGHWVGNWIDA